MPVSIFALHSSRLTTRICLFVSKYIPLYTLYPVCIHCAFTVENFIRLLKNVDVKTS